jgi:hypothetical protein
MSALPLAFAQPLVLFALLALPVIWWLLRLTPPRPQTETFPPTAILARIGKREETPSRSPWWLTLLRLLMAALVILAMAGPVLNPSPTALTGSGPVLIAIDNGWASAAEWESRKASAASLVRAAQEDSRPVILIATTEAATAAPLAPEAAMARLEAMRAMPLKPDHSAAAAAIAEAVRLHAPGSAFFLSDGLSREGTPELAAAFGSTAAQREVLVASAEGLAALAGVSNDPRAMSGVILRPSAAASGERTFEVTASDIDSLPLARRRVTFAAGADTAEFRFDEPVELRNQIVRVDVAEAGNAAAVQLLDDSYRRRLVGLVSGQSGDLAQPLLSSMHYITRALSPFSDIRESLDANVAAVIPELLNQGVSAIVLADVGNLPDETVNALTQWMERGGMLIRFAGPRLAASQDDTLLPVRLRQGDRDLGGALSWEEPKPIAPFEPGSPFFGIDAPRDVAVRRQVLALQEADLQDRTWAVLEDGTPLVTAQRRQSGWIVLVHTSADASWSNLAISGTFVEMLRRIVNLSRSRQGAAAGETVSLPPLRLLDAAGRFEPPPQGVRPLALKEGETPATSAENPPGFYGTQDGFVALNLMRAGDRLASLDPAIFPAGFRQGAYAQDAATVMRPWLLAAAGLLLLLDCLAVLFMAGALRGLRLPARGAATAAILAAILFLPAGKALAQTTDGEAVDFSAALVTRIAYVVTGDAEVDAVSRAGVAGLSRFLASRTALEPGEPAAIDVSRDELAFYSILYWPISVNAELPDAATMARIDAFMKQGGTVLFDTRDQASGIGGGTASSPEALRLQAMLSDLDIPPLEPVPPDHVLTKSFYLLDRFPGRYSAGELWVEALPVSESPVDRPVRTGDGVSSILITSNDFAAAWAVDETLRPMFQTVPPDPMQREFAFRSGVNIMMYVLTGNYKADQVHIPALLERLGQ